MSALSAWCRNRLLSQSTAKPSTFLLSRWIFLRLLGCVYLAAFCSLGVQLRGLIGSRGILPVADYLRAVRDVTGAERYYLAPTLFWLDSADGSLDGLCAGGVILSVLLILGLAPAVVLFLLWAFYLSLTVAGQVFLGYQWDALLLESGFLAIFLAPPHLRPRLSGEAPPSRLVLWLFRWLLFRLMFSSGVVKLLSGDETWRSLTALHYHYQTQPLPIWTSWYMHQLPGWFQQLSVLLMFFAELLVPLFLFGPRRWRHAACGGIAGFQLLIAATGNYGFFNLLSMVLCVLQLDDDFFPARLRSRLRLAADASAAPGRRNWPNWLIAPLAAVILIMSGMPFVENCGLLSRAPAFFVRAQRVVASFRSVNSYGLFAIMTSRRPEIIVEGSHDGTTWLPYEFKWKPGNPAHPPAFTGPHLPRLDWQMWFAALGRFRDNPWFANFLLRLLQGSPEVLALLEENPFPDQPPRYIRAVLYEYHFSDPATREQTGAWWRRERIGLYCPVLSLQRETALPSLDIVKEAVQSGGRPKEKSRRQVFRCRPITEMPSSGTIATGHSARCTRPYIRERHCGQMASLHSKFPGCK